LRILQITAGAGGMYCGSCLRDNALAAEMMARGDDVTLLPVYTPTLTDERNVSEGQVFFGGISVYLEQKFPLFRKTPAILDKLWDSAPVIRMASGRGVSVEAKDLGELTVSTLRGEDGYQAKEIRKLVAHVARLPRFDVVVIPMSLLLGLAPPLRRALGCPVVCTLQGDDLFLEGLGEPYRSESKALIARHAPVVDAFVATSDYYSDFMASYLGLPREKIHTVPLGISLDGHDPSPRPRHEPFTIGYFARIAPEKGLRELALAYRILRRDRGLPPSRLRAAGYLAPEHRAYLAAVEASLREWGLHDEFRCEGTVDRAGKLAFLRSIDVLSVPSPYAEPKGMYLLEAMANAVPVVAPRHGAFPEVLARTGGGLLFTPNDMQSLADAILDLHRHPLRAAELGKAGADGVRRHYTAAHMAEATRALCERAARGESQPAAAVHAALR
jgi:glycosyltransferase involved in cell wall biosynthesis